MSSSDEKTQVTGKAARSLLLDFILGRFTGRTLRLIMLIMAISFGSLIVGAILAFPAPGYSPILYSISSLGSPEKNPAGWWLFSLAMWVEAAFLFPFFLHVRLVFARYASRRSILLFGAIVMIIAGLVLLGFFPEWPATDRYHYMAAALAFGGFFIACCISLVNMYRMSRGASNSHQLTIRLAIIGMIVAFAATVSGSALAFAAISAGTLPGSSLWANLFFWEWLYFGAIGVYIFLLEVVVSRDREPASS